MVDDLVSRVLSALTRLEEQAQACPPWPWRANAEHDEVLAADGEVVCEGFALSNRQLRATVDHVVANDPDHVLRLCRSLRDIVALHKPVVDLADVTYCRLCTTGASCDHCLDERDRRWPCDELLILARGLGIEEDTDG